MSLLYGVFTTDGEYEKGIFPGIDKDLPELVKRLADSDVALFLNISETQVVIGSQINLKIQGGRNDSRIFILQYGNGNKIQALDLPDILKRFFPSAIEYLQGLKYQVLDVWGEEGFIEKISGLEDRPLPLIGDNSHIVAGKLLTGQPVHVEAKDLFRAMCLLAEVAAIMKPFASLEYTFVISRLSFVDADLSAGPNKPLNTEFDLNLESGKSLALAGLEPKYRQLVKNSKGEVVLRKISQKAFKSKRDLAIFMIEESSRGARGIEMLDWDRIASPLGLYVSLSANEAIDAVLKTGNASFWNRYISGPDFNLQEFRTAVEREPWGNFEKFIRLIQPSLGSTRDSLKPALYHVFMEKIGPVQTRRDQMSGLLAGLKSETRQGPVKGRSLPEKTSLERERSPGRYIALGILILIIAVVLVRILFFPGESQAGGAPSEQLTENGETLAILNITNGTGLYKGISRIPPGRFSGANTTTFDNQTYYLNMSKLIDIAPGDIQIQGTLRIYIPELTNSTGFIGHFNQTSKTWENFIEVIRQPDFTIPVTSGGLYGVFS